MRKDACERETPEVPPASAVNDRAANTGDGDHGQPVLGAEGPVALAAVKGETPVRVGPRRVSRKGTRPGLVWKLHPRVVNDLEQKVGKFTIEAYVPSRSTTSHVSKCYATSTEFLKSRLPEKGHILVVGPDPHLGAVIRRVSRARKQQPELHVTIVLPGHPYSDLLVRISGSHPTGCWFDPRRGSKTLCAGVPTGQ